MRLKLIARQSAYNRCFQVAFTQPTRLPEKATMSWQSQHTSRNEAKTIPSDFQVAFSPFC